MAVLLVLSPLPELPPTPTTIPSRGLHRPEEVAAAGQQLSFHLRINQADYLGQFHSATRQSSFFLIYKAVYWESLLYFEPFIEAHFMEVE